MEVAGFLAPNSAALSTVASTPIYYCKHYILHAYLYDDGAVYILIFQVALSLRELKRVLCKHIDYLTLFKTIWINVHL